MSIEVKTIDVNQVKVELKKCPKIVREYVRSLESVYEINKSSLNRAISVTRCCETLKDKETISFEDFVDKYYRRKDFKYFNKKGKAFTATQIVTIYDEHINKQ